MATLASTRQALIGLVTGQVELEAAIGDGTVDGDPQVLGRVVALLAAFARGFAIVTPDLRATVAWRARDASKKQPRSV